MNTAAEVLLIIVSATLTLFLLIAIVALVLFIKILREIKRIAAKAEKIADQAEHVSNFFQKTAGPAAIAKLIANLLHSLRLRKSKKKEY